MTVDRILLASGNAKKRTELAELLQPLDLKVLVPADVGGLPEVIEDQDSFAGNAAKKALSAAAHSGLWCLADDSGLEVDHLGGAPGIFSARFAGPACDDEANNELLLAKLANVPDPERGAGFMCALALARPGPSGASGPGPTVQLACEGRVRGTILRARRGSHGFGYDPLFCFAESDHPLAGKTFAELDRAAKASISHRARALQQLVTQLPVALEATQGN